MAALDYIEYELKIQNNYIDYDLDDYFINSETYELILDHDYAHYKDRQYHQEKHQYNQYNFKYQHDDDNNQKINHLKYNINHDEDANDDHDDHDDDNILMMDCALQRDLIEEVEEQVIGIDDHPYHHQRHQQHHLNDDEEVVDNIITGIYGSDGVVHKDVDIHYETEQYQTSFKDQYVDPSFYLDFGDHQNPEIEADSNGNSNSDSDSNNNAIDDTTSKETRISCENFQDPHSKYNEIESQPITTTITATIPTNPSPLHFTSPYLISPQYLSSSQFISPQYLSSHYFSLPQAMTSQLLSSQAMISQGLSPHTTMTLQSLSPYTTITSQLLSPHATMTLQGLSPQAMTSQPLSPHTTMTSQGLSPHTTMTSPGLSPHITMTSQLHSPHTTMTLQGLSTSQSIPSLSPTWINKQGGKGGGGKGRGRGRGNHVFEENEDQASDKAEEVGKKNSSKQDGTIAFLRQCILELKAGIDMIFTNKESEYKNILWDYLITIGKKPEIQKQPKKKIKFLLIPCLDACNVYNGLDIYHSNLIRMKCYNYIMSKIDTNQFILNFTKNRNYGKVNKNGATVNPLHAEKKIINTLKQYFEELKKPSKFRGLYSDTTYTPDLYWVKRIEYRVQLENQLV